MPASSLWLIVSKEERTPVPRARAIFRKKVSKVSMPHDRIIGQRAFTDGTERDVYRDEHGQYIDDDDGEKVYGVWILDAEALDDAPLIVAGESRA